jgi:uncharacterized protein (TIGR00251 family)
MLDETVKKHQDGTIINLFVTPGSNKNVFPSGVNQWRKRIEIKVRSTASDNKANLDVIKIVAGFFDKKVSKVMIIKGKKNREKTVLVIGIKVDNAINKIQESLDGL